MSIIPDIPGPSDTAGRLDAVVLDFDGLILDTELAEFRSLEELYAAHDDLLEFAEWQATVGSVDVDWVARLEERTGTRIDHAETARALLRRQRELVAAEPALPGVEELVTVAHDHRVPVGVATSGERDRVCPELERRGLLAAIHTVVTREDVARTKPAPDPYLRAAQALGVQPERCVALEDSQHGVSSATAAGMRCVAVPSDITVGQDFSAAALVVPGIDRLDLLALMRGELRTLTSGEPAS